MDSGVFSNVTNQDKTKAIETLITHSRPRPDFFLMIALSVLMATFGLLINSTAVIIGSMLLAPMLYPILSLSMGIIMSDYKLIVRASYTLLKSMLYALIASALITVFFSTQYENLSSDIIIHTQPTIIAAAVAVIAGLAASFALVKSELNETFPGVVVAVALVPPLAASGIGIGKLDWSMTSGSLLLFLINVLGIVFASMVVFSFMNFYVAKRKVSEEVKREEKNR